MNFKSNFPIWKLILLLIVSVFVFLFYVPIHRNVLAQGIYELSCAPGTRAIDALTTYNVFTGLYRQNVCAASNGNLILNSVTSSIFANINNMLYISQFAGSDLGAKSLAAVTNCTVTLGLNTCKYFFDSGGTISTPPNFPMGSTVECTATSPIVLATTWAIIHRNTNYFMNSCSFQYNQDSGSAAILVSKNIAPGSTVNTQNLQTGGCTP